MEESRRRTVEPGSHGLHPVRGQQAHKICSQHCEGCRKTVESRREASAARQRTSHDEVRHHPHGPIQGKVEVLGQERSLDSMHSPLQEAQYQQSVRLQDLETAWDEVLRAPTHAAVVRQAKQQQKSKPRALQDQNQQSRNSFRRSCDIFFTNKKISLFNWQIERWIPSKCSPYHDILHCPCPSAP